MKKRQPSYRKVKIHRSYTVEEVASLFGTHKNTVRSWLKSGLPMCDSRRPVLVLGHDLAAYLRARQDKRKQPCKAGQLYCLRCRMPKSPGGGMVEYIPETPTLGLLKSVCPDCFCMMNRRARYAELSTVCGDFSITVTEAPDQVSKRDEANLNSDFGKEA